jgi:hypothetical protein
VVDKPLDLGMGSPTRSPHDPRADGGGGSPRRVNVPNRAVTPAANPLAGVEQNVLDQYHGEPLDIPNARVRSGGRALIHKAVMRDGRLVNPQTPKGGA